MLNLASSKRFQDIVRQQNVAFILAICLAGGALIALSFYVEPQSAFISRLLLTFGSSFLGTGFGILFNSYTNQSGLIRMRELIEHTIRGPLSAPDEVLDGFRSKMHNYLLTQQNGKWIWRYRQFDFTKIQTPGKLIATVTVSDPKRCGAFHEYVYEAYLTGSRMILVGVVNKSAEPPVVHLYPFATERYSDHFVGEAFLRSWDGHDLASTPVVMAIQKLALSEPYEEGTLSEKLGVEMTETWHNGSNRFGTVYSGGNENG